MTTTRLQLASGLTSALTHADSQPDESATCHDHNRQSASSIAAILPTSATLTSPSSPSSESDTRPIQISSSSPDKPKRLVKRRHRVGVYHINPPPGFGSPFHRAKNNRHHDPPELSASSDTSASDSSASQGEFDLSHYELHDLGASNDPDHLPLVISKPSVSSRPLPTRGTNHNKAGATQDSQRIATTTSASKTRNSSTFWDLITDVAKDLDLELQDLSPDKEIFNKQNESTTHTSDKHDNVVGDTRTREHGGSCQQSAPPPSSLSSQPNREPSERRASQKQPQLEHQQSPAGQRCQSDGKRASQAGAHSHQSARGKSEAVAREHQAPTPSLPGRNNALRLTGRGPSGARVRPDDHEQLAHTRAQQAPARPGSADPVARQPKSPAHRVHLLGPSGGGPLVVLHESSTRFDEDFDRIDARRRSPKIVGVVHKRRSPQQSTTTGSERDRNRRSNGPLLVQSKLVTNVKDSLKLKKCNFTSSSPEGGSSAAPSSPSRIPRLSRSSSTDHHSNTQGPSSVSVRGLLSTTKSMSFESSPKALSAAENVQIRNAKSTTRTTASITRLVSSKPPQAPQPASSPTSREHYRHHRVHDLNNNNKKNNSLHHPRQSSFSSNSSAGSTSKSCIVANAQTSEVDVCHDEEGQDLPEGNVDDDEEEEEGGENEMTVIEDNKADNHSLEEQNEEAAFDSIEIVGVRKLRSSPAQAASENSSDETTTPKEEMDIDLEERFRISQPIWYLPSINRASVVHYLQGKPVGVFIVRQSSKPNTMALSVRLPQGKGPHVEHYLVEKETSPTTNRSVFHLEGSEHYFTTILRLVVHYAKFGDELPTRLDLVSVLLTSGCSQLVSLALLGQQFWQSKFVNLRQLPKNSLNNETLELITKGGTGQKSRRHNSNSSESTNACSSTTATASNNSMSPVPQPRRSLTRAGQTNRVSPLSIEGVSMLGTSTSVVPPPLPPKANDTAHPLIGESACKKVVLLTPVADNHKLPPTSSPVNETCSAQNPPTSMTPSLPPRNPPQPPPLPPRCQRSELLRIAVSERKATNASSATNNLSALNDLLSPISLTESEIELAKYNSRLEEKEVGGREQKDGTSPPVPPKSAAILAAKNYYNHMEGNSKKAEPGTKPLAKLSSPTQAELKNGQSNLKVAVDVYTQTDKDKLKMLRQTSARPGSSLSMSSYYMDPVDALRSHQTTTITGSESIVSSKRHSDTELASSTLSAYSMLDLHRNGRVGGRNDYSLSSSNWYTMGKHSLESLLAAFRQKFPTQQADAAEVYEAREEALKVDAKRTGDEIQTSVVSTWQWKGGFQVPGPVSGKPSPGPMIVRQAPGRPSSRSTTTTSPGNAFQQIVNVLVNGTEMNAAGPINKRTSQLNQTIKSNITTIEDRITAQAPELVVPKLAHVSGNSKEQAASQSSPVNHDRSNSGSQIKALNHKHEHSNDTTTTMESAGTEFSEPWQSIDALETMFLNDFGPTSLGSNLENGHLSCELLKNDMIHFNSHLLKPEEGEEDDLDDYDNVAGSEEDDEGSVDEGIVAPQVPPRARKPVTMKRDDASDSTLTNAMTHGGGGGQADHEMVMLSIVENISCYIIDLASRRDNTFAMSIANFIQCTKESTETNPTVILGYIRQFMNGMKNYLLKHGEADFLVIVKRESARLAANQFLNIDSILECALQRLIIQPLKSHIYDHFIHQFNNLGSLKILSNNLKMAQTRSGGEFGIRSALLPLDAKAMGAIQRNLARLQQSYSPIKKLEHLLRCIAIINAWARGKVNNDDLVPLLVYIIVQCGLISAEIEIEYMLGLLHPSILNGEGSYYLSVFSSAIQVLKNMYTADSERQLKDVISLTPSAATRTGALLSSKKQPVSDKLRNLHNYCKGMENGKTSAGVASCKSTNSAVAMAAGMKILIPNELTSSITSKSVPVRPTMTTREVCRMLAHSLRITNPEDYALFRIGNENGLDMDIPLGEADFPYAIRLEIMARGREPLFAYKRCDAKFIWPSVVN